MSINIYLYISMRQSYLSSIYLFIFNHQKNNYFFIIDFIITRNNRICNAISILKYPRDCSTRDVLKLSTNTILLNRRYNNTSRYYNTYQSPIRYVASSFLHRYVIGLVIGIVNIVNVLRTTETYIQLTTVQNYYT